MNTVPSILGRLRRGIITEDTARERLRNLGLCPVEIERVMR